MVSSPVNVATEGSVPSDICTANTSLFMHFLPKSWQAVKEGMSVFPSPLFLLHLPPGSLVLQYSKKWNHRCLISTYLGPQCHLEPTEDLSLVFSRILSPV